MTGISFSALQRAENSSIVLRRFPYASQVPFQCSSASRKFLNYVRSATNVVCPPFQCSSASRKFLNLRTSTGPTRRYRVSVLFSEPKIPQLIAEAGGEIASVPRFSALQRAENSSICRESETTGIRRCVSVLFSEPKIPQSCVLG